MRPAYNHRGRDTSHALPGSRLSGAGLLSWTSLPPKLALGGTHHWWPNPFWPWRLLHSACTHLHSETTTPHSHERDKECGDKEAPNILSGHPFLGIQLLGGYFVKAATISAQRPSLSCLKQTCLTRGSLLLPTHSVGVVPEQYLGHSAPLASNCKDPPPQSPSVSVPP